MKLSLHRLLASFALVAGALSSLPAQAMAYSSLTVFGDSLSDVGNIKIVSPNSVPSPPYFNGRFSDGPNWIDVLAAGLGLPSASVPSFGGGTNYAFGGARTGQGQTPPGVLAQVGGLWGPTHPTADPTGLYVVVGGGNDMRDARGASSTDQSRQDAADAAADNIFKSVFALASKGAQHVMISTLPDLGATPEAVNAGLVATSTDATLRYNAAVAGLEAQLEALFADLDVIVLDMYGVAAGVRSDALNNGGAVFGITNTTLPCFVVGGCAKSLFSDTLHPSSAAHALIGAVALNLAVPLPATLALLGAGLLLLGAQRRRAR